MTFFTRLFLNHSKKALDDFSKDVIKPLTSPATTYGVLTRLALHRLTLPWRMSLSYRNQSIDLQGKSADWFLYDRDLRHERVKMKSKSTKMMLNNNGSKY